MRKVLLLTIVATFLVSSVAFPGCGCSDDDKGTNKSATKKEATKEANSNTQSYCPIDSTKINNNKNKKEVSIVYQGKKIHFCCEKCKKKFGKSPRKHIESMLERDFSLENNTEGKKFTDPVSGKKVRPNKFSTYYEGQFYYFSSERTIDRFRQQPEKYLNQSKNKKK